MSSSTKPLVALTGATGFIGQWLLRELPKRGYRLLPAVEFAPDDDPGQRAPALTETDGANTVPPARCSSA